MNHSDQFQPSCYQFDSTGLCRAQDPTKCNLRFAGSLTWWIAALLPSSMAPVHTGTKTEVARISKKFSHRLANFGAWQGSWEYSESTPWPPLQALLKAGLWVSDREDVEAHRRLLVRPVLNPAVEVSRGEVAKVNVGKGSESGEIWAYDGSVTAVPNEIKMLKYNLVIVEVPRRGGWIPGAQIVRVLSQGVLGAFHGHHGDLVAVEQHLRSQLEDLYPTALRMAMYHLGRREEPYLFEQSTLLLVKTHGLGPAVPHFLTQKSFTEGLWLGLAILWWLVNLLEDPNEDSDDTHMAGDASRCLWALYYGRRPDLISLGCIYLPVPLNCAWGVLSDGPYNAADVVNLLKTSVRKGDTQEDVEWRSVTHWASTGQPLFRQESPDQAADADTSESEVEEVPDPQTPKPKGRNTEKQRQKEHGKAERESRKQEEAREKQRKKEEKEKEKKAREDERANRKRKEEEDKLATAAAGASPSQKKRAVEGPKATLQRGVRVGLSKSNGKSNGK